MQKVLIVDDNPVNVKVLSATLAELGYDLLTVNTGERALMVSERASPDLILLDVNMPGINGFEACRRLKQNPKTKDIPVIFLTALNEIESKMEGFEAGGVDYISKPFNNKEVCVRVENHLKISMLSKELERKNALLTDALEEVTTTQEKLLDLNQMLLDSITYSRRIQVSILPSDETVKQIFPSSFVYYQPKDIVSGDFYWVYENENVKIMLVADCTGHGVPGAFMSLLGVNSLRHIVQDMKITSPSEILRLLDDDIITALNQNFINNLEELKMFDGMDVAICCFHLAEQRLVYSSAHRPMLFTRNNQIELLAPKSPSIGFDGFNNKPSFENYEMSIQKGDRFFLYSDGITDQFGGEKNKKYTPLQLRNEILNSLHLPISEQYLALKESLVNWKISTAQTDDMTLVGIEI